MAQTKHKAKQNEVRKGPRNGNLFDKWSVVHFATGVLMGWLMAPFVAICLMIAWEPLEIFVLSPIFAKWGIEFGYESLRNSLSDICFDAAGVAAGAYLLVEWIAPPFHLFG